jgi:hypothetical protein
MHTRVSRRKLKEMEDANTVAARIVAQTTGQKTPPPAEPAKNPAAVALGKLGASKGGKARALKLSKKDRLAIAKLAAKARWDKHL